MTVTHLLLTSPFLHCLYTKPSTINKKVLGWSSVFVWVSYKFTKMHRALQAQIWILNPTYFKFESRIPACLKKWTPEIALEFESQKFKWIFNPESDPVWNLKPESLVHFKLEPRIPGLPLTGPCAWASSSRFSAKIEISGRDTFQCLSLICLTSGEMEYCELIDAKISY